MSDSKSKNKAEKTSVNANLPILESMKNNWYKYKSRFNLKINDKDIAEELLNHKEINSPQAIQGMWQAYGQMRAARTISRVTLLTSGIIGIGLWRYQQSIRKEAKELVASQKELAENQKKLDQEKKDHAKTINDTLLMGKTALLVGETALIAKNKFKLADDMIKDFYKDDKENLDKYNNLIQECEEKTLKQYNKEIINMRVDEVNDNHKPKI